MEERVVWHPVTAEQKAAVRVALADILSNSHFCNSKRYPAFLQHVVEAILSGRADELKERTLGIEVFGRRPDYDTNTDTIVRYTAGEVRKRLALYYSEAQQPPAIRIHLPIGSYVPELMLLAHTAPEERSAAAQVQKVEVDYQINERQQPAPFVSDAAEFPASEHAFPGVRKVARRGWYDQPQQKLKCMPRRVLWMVAGGLLLFALLSTFLFHRHLESSQGDAVLQSFWAPILNASGTTLICSGSVVFANNSFSGVTTALKGTDYSFMSVQIAASIARLSAYLERHGATYQVQTSASTSLTDLRERPVILVGGYNNAWSRRLLEPLRFHFAPKLSAPGILDAQQPARLWARDQTQDYGSTDDYAIVARFRDSMSDSPVVVLAGLGRNGTEAAAQFVTSPEFLAQYAREHKLSGKGNVEFVLHTGVVEGKTGAPSIVAFYQW